MAPRSSITALLAILALVAAGCGDKVPEMKTADGSNPHVTGTPQERIARIEADPTLSLEEKARRIALVKERNHLK